MVSQAGKSMLLQKLVCCSAAVQSVAEDHDLLAAPLLSFDHLQVITSQVSAQPGIGQVLHLLQTAAKIVRVALADVRCCCKWCSSSRLKPHLALRALNTLCRKVAFNEDLLYVYGEHSSLKCQHAGKRV